MDKRKALSELFLFRSFNFELLDKKYSISARSTEKTYSDGELILDSKYSDGLPIVIKGKARITSGDSDRSAVLRTLGEGECFGAGTLFADSSAHNTKVRSVGLSSIITIPRPLLEEILMSEPECAMRYIEFLSDRISFLNKKITAFTAGSAEAKLAVYLVGLEAGDGGTAVLDTSLSALSSQLGIGRASLYRALDCFEENGIIERNVKKVTLLRPDKLRSMIQ